jgi:tetratricopeptide (TPR) repeat protein
MPFYWILLLFSQSPTPQALFQERRYAEAAALLERQDSSRGGRYLLGLCYQQMGELGKAETVLTGLTAKEPKWAPGYYALGRVLFVEGKFPDALRVVAEAERLGEPVPRTRRLMGSIEEERGDFAAALLAYDAAVRADSSVSEAHSGRASVLFKLGRLAEARAAASEALRLAGGNEDAARILRQASAVVAAGGAQATGVAFERRELDFVLEHSPAAEKHVVSTMAGGLAAFDFDNDGLLDLFFTNGAELPSLRKSAPKYWNRLYRNMGGLRFVDVTAEAGLAGEGFSIGAAAADFDGDGWTDLFVAGAGKSLLYRNEKGRFTLTPRGIRDEKFAVGGAWLDYDLDGRLDLFVVNYLDWTPAFSKFCGDAAKGLRVYCHPREFAPAANRLYRNLGDGTFADVSVAMGVAGHLGKGMSAAVADVDGDGRPDIFVANDAMPNFFFKNAGGKFVESALAAGVAYNDMGKPISSMGSDLRDYDNDGRPDLIFTALVGETFPVFRNTGEGFRDVTYPSGSGALTVRRSGWGVALADLNNDGWKDLVTANSHVTDTIELTRAEKYREPNVVLLNAGGKFRMGTELGPAAANRGLAVADLDGDGRLDIVTSALGGKAVLWRNVSAGTGNWLEVKAPVGARVRAGKQWQEVTAGGSYGSGSFVPAHFGLGAAAEAEVEIILPGGRRKALGVVQAGR